MNDKITIKSIYLNNESEQAIKSGLPIRADGSIADPNKFGLIGFDANYQTIEKEIQAKGLTAPRITPDAIEANIVHEHYFTAREGCEGAGMGGGTYHESLSLLTFCVLVLRNGFTVTGESACVSAQNYDAELGRKIARTNAQNKIWTLMGYALRSQLAGA